MIWINEMDQIIHIWTPKMFIDYSSELDPDSGFHSFLYMENNIIKEDRREKNHRKKELRAHLAKADTLLFLLDSFGQNL